MADMENFLGNVVIDSIKDNQRLNQLGNQDKLIGQRKVNLIQQEQITNDREYIRTLEQTVKSLKEEISTLKQSQSSGIDTLTYDPFTDRVISPGQKKFEEGFYQGLQKGTQQVAQEYEALLAKPFQEIAQKNGNFKETYEAQMELMADWMVSQKAFKELAIEFGFDAHGYTPEQVWEMGMDKKIDVLQDNHDASHGTNFSDSTHPESRREVLLNKALKDKADRKSKKVS